MYTRRIAALLLIVCILFSMGAVAKTKVKVTSTTRVYQSATTRSKSVKIKKNTIVYLLDKQKTWSKIQNPSNNYTGYIKTKYIKETTVTQTKVQKLITYAKSFLGRPYKQNGRGPKSFDCSNFISYCFKHIGISLSGSITKLGNTTSHMTRIYNLNECRAGDILFFDTNETNNRRLDHAAIHIGNNQMIHASYTAGKVIISSISDYYHRTFVWALRSDKI